MKRVELRVGEKTVDENDIAHVRDLLSSHPTWSRRHLSLELAQQWGIRTPSGQLKDISVRALLRKLDQRGQIILPPPRQPSSRRKPFNLPELFESCPPTPVEEPLSNLLPLHLEVVTYRHPCRGPFEQLLARHHYLGYRGPVGEHLNYLVTDCHQREIACLVFNVAAWKIKPRDTFLGWDAATRTRRLSYLTNNTRFLILPWVRVPHLASHLLGLITRRLAQDWQAKYAHPVYAVETFVERHRFRGTCYRAANWIYLGQTQGRTRADRFNTIQVPVKDIYLYPLTPQFRKKLCHGDP